MATSGTFTWNLDVAEIIEEAYDNCGIELRTGYQLKSARRSLNMLLTEWINDGVNLWTIEEMTVTLTADTASFTLDAKYTDVLDAVVRDSNNNDVSCTRVSLSEYLNRTDKSTSGRPVQYVIERNSNGGHTLSVWPVQDVSTYTFVAWAIRYIEDIDTTYTDNVDIPRRFIPALTFGLAYKLAIKNKETVGIEDRAELEKEYMRTYQAAKDEDRERVSLFLVPNNR
jgi:hypothetical protein